MKLYEELTTEERDGYILEVVELLLHGDLPTAGEHRLLEWEAGWAEALDDRQSIPRYHGKHKLLHWEQRIVRPLIPYLDYYMHCMVVDWAVATYLGHMDTIYDFGCGTADHLLRARRYTGARLVGLDWAKASQDIISEIGGIEGRNFNFYEPDYSLDFPPNSGVLTIAALEQVGERFEPFLQFLLEKRPAICVHVEPIDELMDQGNLIDMLSVWYCHKRNYLRGFLTRLRQLQDQDKVDILLERRTHIGSYFIEGHSLVVWAPKGGK